MVNSSVKLFNNELKASLPHVIDTEHIIFICIFFSWLKKLFMCHQMANEHEKKQKAKSSSRQTSVSDFEDALTHTHKIYNNFVFITTQKIK